MHAVILTPQRRAPATTPWCGHGWAAGPPSDANIRGLSRPAAAAVTSSPRLRANARRKIVIHRPHRYHMAGPPRRGALPGHPGCPASACADQLHLRRDEDQQRSHMVINRRPQPTCSLARSPLLSLDKPDRYFGDRVVGLLGHSCGSPERHPGLDLDALQGDLRRDLRHRGGKTSLLHHSSTSTWSLADGHAEQVDGHDISSCAMVRSVSR